MRLENAQLQARLLGCGVVWCAVLCFTVQNLEHVHLSKARLPARCYANFHAML